MVSCKLCGYHGHNNTNTQCPVCGEPYDSPQDGHMPGSRLAQAAAGSWCGVSRQMSRVGGLEGYNNNSTGGATGSTYLNLDLQALLHLIPEQQDRKKRAEDVVRATGAGLSPTKAKNGRHAPDVVYIQQRADPTMTVLKGRYNTQPRIAKATSMSALNRLAHPLMGYDSMGALGPEARKRRQESADRVLRQSLTDGNLKGTGEVRHLNKSRSAVELSESKNMFLPRRSSGGAVSSRTPLAISVNAVHLRGRKKSVEPAVPPQRRSHRRDSRGRLSQTGEIAAASPLLRLRASKGRRVKSILRRKRVATMRSVDGWVRETDPASTRRQGSLDRRMVALRKRGNHKVRDNRKGSRPLRNSVGGTRRDSNLDGGSTFLTELEPDGARHVPEAGLSQGHEGVGSWVNGCDAPRRRNSTTANPAQQYSRVGGGSSNPGRLQRQQARRRSSGAQRGPSSIEFRARRVTESSKIPGRSRSEGTRIKAKVERTKSVGALDRYSKQQAAQSRVGQNSVRGGAGERGQEGPNGQALAPAPVPPQPPDLSGEMNAGRVVTVNAAAWTSSYPGMAELEVEIANGKGTDAHEADSTMAPAWGVLGSHAASPSPEESGSRLAWQGDEPGISTRPCSEWHLLRGGGASSLSRSADLLRSFENKVGRPFSEDRRRSRPASATPAVSNDETAVSQQQPLLSEGEHGGGRHRHHRPLSREEEPGGKPPLPSKSSLAAMHNRPESSGWFHRRSLPSLLSNGTPKPPPWAQRTKLASTPPKEPSGGGGAMARKRGKRRTPLEEPSGRMQRLDKASTAVTVGDAIARSGWGSRGSGESRGRAGSQTEMVSAGEFGDRREAGGTPPLPVQTESGLDGRASKPGSSGRGRALDGKLWSSAVPKSLLYVGSGGGFRLRL